jgi:hypothetical protein
MQAEFQLLNSKLVSKGANGEKAEKSCMRYWSLWQKREADLKEISLEWPRTYDIENLAQDLENALTAKTIVMSKTFKAAVQKQVVRQYMPMAEPKLLADIDNEIDKAMEEAEEAAARISDENIYGGADTGSAKPGGGPGVSMGTQSTEEGKVVPLPGTATGGGE